MTRRAVLQVAFGPHAGHKIVLDPGQVLRVGRGDEADVVVRGDRRLAAVHFELDWDGASCEVRARQGERTLVGGLPIDRVRLPDGGFVRAGDSYFVLSHEAAPPDDAAWTPAQRDAHRALRAVTHLWGVFDTAVDERVLSELRASVDPARSLYEGVRGDALADAAPWLVQFRSDSALLERLVGEGWGAGWGIYLEYAGSERSLRRQLRRLLVVEEEDSRRKLYLRFYDPRVLRDFLPTCSPRQLDTFFGPVERFHAEGERGELLEFARANIASIATEDL